MICLSRFDSSSKRLVNPLGSSRVCLLYTSVAKPHCSEHQSGLAVDLARDQPEIDPLCPEFPTYGICGLFRKRAAAFGFIERYPRGKESVTKIGYEPWHFRYVGFPHSVLIQRNGLCLEEYLTQLKQYPAHGKHLQLSLIHI